MCLVRRFILFIVLGIYSGISSANNVAYDDLPYVRLKKEDMYYILPNAYKYFAEKIINTNSILMELYDTEYGFRLDGETEYIFASHLSQIGNGYVSMLPFSTAVLYPGGVFKFDDFATTNWLATLVYHETTHLYQLSTNNSGPGKFSQLFLGNNWVNFLPLPIKIFPLVTIPLPILTYPNVFMPDFLLEGNATFNESRFGYGGRLYSGHYRAMFYMMLNKNLLRPDRVLMNHVDFPFQREKYIGGAYFWAHLAYEYGFERAAQFFKYFSTKYLNPSRFYNAFEEYFARSFDDYLMTAFADYRVQANAQLRFSKSELISTSAVYNPLNKNEKGIFYLNSDTGKSDRELIVVKNRDEVFRTKTNLLPGKIFEINEYFYSAAVSLVDRKKQLPSLWGVDMKPFKAFNDKYVMDIRGELFVYADGKRSIERPYIIYKGRDFGEVFSSVLIHPQQELVYFKQEGKKRTLMLGNKELYSYKGYYGKPVDVMPTGGILFIAPTARGSGLYMHSMGETVRVGRSDLVVDARWIESKYFLVVELSKNGYEYRVAHIEDAKFDPVFEYAFYFEKDGWNEKVPFESKKIETSPVEYNEFKTLKYSRSNLFFNSITHGDTSVIGNATLVDPLNYNTIYLGFDIDSESREKYYNFSYVNQKRLLNWGVLFDSEPSQILGSLESKNSFRGLLKYHYSRFNDIDLFLTASSGIGFGHSEVSFDNYFGVDLLRQYYNVIGYDPFDYQSAYVEADLDVDGLQIGGIANYYKSVFDNFYIGAEAFAQFSFREWFDVGRLASGRKRLYPLLSQTLLKEKSQYFASATAGAKKVFEINGYNEYFPLGLRRWAVEGFGGVSKINDDLLAYQTHFGGSLELELILAKRFIQRLKVGVINSSTGTQEFFLGLSDGF